MTAKRTRLHPITESLEGRRLQSRDAFAHGIDAARSQIAVLVADPPSGSSQEKIAASLPGDVNGDGRVDFADEQAFIASYRSKFGDPRYNPAADFNHNGFVGQGDGRVIVRHLTNPGRRIPLRLDLHLAPGQQLRPPLSANSGGETRQRDVTIVGRTTPFSLVFTDSPALDYSFRGPAFVADAHGVFRQPFLLKDALTNFEFLAVDPFGHQTIRAFPILLKSFDSPSDH